MTARGVQRGVAGGLAAIACLAGLITAPRAQADPPPGSPEHDFLQYMALRGRPPGHTPDMLIGLGHMVCDIRHGGGSDDDARLRVFQDLYAHGDPLSWSRSAPDLVTAAEATLCPDVKPG